MNHKNFNQIIEHYIDKFDWLNEKGGNHEGYKWEALRCFQDHWDIEAEDFVSMFQQSMEKAVALSDAGTSQPIGGIMLLLKAEEKDESEFVRQCFRDLFVEDGGDYVARFERVDAFIETINNRIKEYVTSTWKYPQNRTSVIYYLNLWKPEDNYIYKSAEAVEWANATEYGDDFGTGKNFKLDKYYKMCDEVKAELEKNESLLELHRSRFEDGELPFDDDLHLLVYDLIRCAHNYSLYEGIEIKKLTAKQRIKQAVLTEAKETLEDEIVSCQERLDTLKSGEVKLEMPDLQGIEVKHKKFGPGVISNQSITSIEVTFENGTKAFKIPMAVTNGFLSIEDDQLTNQLLDLEENMDGVEKLEKKLTIKRNELDTLMGQ